MVIATERTRAPSVQRNLMIALGAADQIGNMASAFAQGCIAAIAAGVQSGLRARVPQLLDQYRFSVMPCSTFL